jgi:hypothetical protein
MSAKVGILTGSVVSALAGLTILRFAGGKLQAEQQDRFLSESIGRPSSG